MKAWRAAMLVAIPLLTTGCDMCAVRLAHTPEAIRAEVLSDPASVDMPRTGSDLTPLQIAISNNDVEFATWLLDHGASPNAIGLLEMSALESAVLSDKSEGFVMIDLLLRRGIDVNQRNAVGETPLHHFAHTDAHREFVERLIAAGAEVNALSDEGWTPLHTAAQWNCPEAAALLLAAKADPGMRDLSGRTPLHYAALYGRARIASQLLDAGAPIDALDDEGRTPLKCARNPMRDPQSSRWIAGNKAATIEEFVKRGAKE